MRNDDRSTQREAELVLLVGRNGLDSGIKKVLRIKFFVAQKLVNAAMQLVGPGLNSGIDDGAVAPPELGAIGIRLHLEFFQRLDRGLNYIIRLIEQVGQVRVVIYAIEQEIILQRACSVCREAVSAFVAGTRFAGRSPGRQQRQLGEVASV